ncbi:hypothetical protein OPV22_024809 [Ensete ventricosum]|uniref:Uncharacterized protein n=1 Tax=Ensete ventricosum TaxID=4639 RepID=A0AAV8Q5Q7_ENSVE|nr:hypothetical protein OPV22_024809 [Ensete ventricosum]
MRDEGPHPPPRPLHGSPGAIPDSERRRTGIPLCGAGETKLPKGSLEWWSEITGTRASRHGTGGATLLDGCGGHALVEVGSSLVLTLLSDLALLKSVAARENKPNEDQGCVYPYRIHGSAHAAYMPYFKI